MNIFWCAWGETFLREALASALLAKKHNDIFYKNLFNYQIFTHDLGYINDDVLRLYSEKYGIEIVYSDCYIPDNIEIDERTEYMRYHIGKGLLGRNLYLDSDLYTISYYDLEHKNIFQNPIELYHSTKYDIYYEGVREIEDYFGQKKVCFLLEDGERPPLRPKVINLGAIFYENNKDYIDFYEEILSINKKIRKRYKLEGSMSCFTELIVTALYNLKKMPKLFYLEDENFIAAPFEKEFDFPFLFADGDMNNVDFFYRKTSSYNMIHNVHHDKDIEKYTFRFYYLDDDRIVIRDLFRKDIGFARASDEN